MRRLLGVVLPSALLAVLFTAACDMGTPAAPVEPPNLETIETIETMLANKGCPPGFDIEGAVGSPVDRNGDGFVCVKFVGHRDIDDLGILREIMIDNNVRDDGGCDPRVPPGCGGG